MEIFMGYIVLSIFILIVDIMTKLVAELNLRSVDTIPLWNNVFHLTYVENRGIAFGMFSDARLVFIVISILVLAALAVLYSKIGFRTRWLKVGTALIYGGAIGNLMERLAKGYVVDFLDFRLIHFPVFNVADIAVCVGAVMLMIHFFISDKAEEQAKREALARQEEKDAERRPAAGQTDAEPDGGRASGTQENGEDNPGA